jgi:hypothetical protein
VEQKKMKVAIVSPDRKRVTGIMEILLTILPDMNSYGAESLAEAKSKIRNDAPNLLVLDAEAFLPDWIKFIKWITADSDGKATGIVILCAIPKTGVFVDEVMSGQIQFLEPLSTEAGIKECFQRALNFINPDARNSEIKMRNVVKGERIIEQGGRGVSVFILKSGRLEAVRRESTGKVSVIGHILPGEFVGEMAYINGDPRSADVIALEKSELIEIPVGTVDTILLRKPHWSRAMIKTLARRLKEASHK